MSDSSQKWSSTFVWAAIVCVIADWRVAAVCFLLLAFVRNVKEDM